ncbi:HAD family hydrolase [Streptomyces sp. NPDC056844]|uniref:HAD family hydrolase n=1 Tax=unclassified Streptomyces TaxID=2593676 RepID=UPI0036BF9D76
MKTIVFDIGETLVRDDRLWASWADWLGVPPHTVSALVGAAVAQGRDATDALRVLRPGMDVGEAYQARAAAGRGEHLDETDLYPDVRPALAELRALGLRVVVAGDRTARAGELLRALDLPADLVVTSEEWGVAKPDREFFARVLEVSGASPESTLYVGDHPADDLFPAKSCGLRAAHIRRGPYGHWWADHPDVLETADWRVSALTELPALLGGTKRRMALAAPPERATVPEQTGPAAPSQDDTPPQEQAAPSPHDSPQEAAPPEEAPPQDDAAPSGQSRA